nr:hypothetical protein [Neobacillus sp. Marseille-Q6967]
MLEESQLIVPLLIAIFVVNLITMILVIVSMKKKSDGQVKKAAAQVAAASQTKVSAVTGIVFCRNCGNQYDSTLNKCPKC